MPALEPPEGGEFVLVSPSALGGAGGGETLVRLIYHLAEAGASGLGLVGDLSPAVRAAADERGFSVLSLTPSANLRELERKIAALIVDRRLRWEEQAEGVYAGLVQLAIEGRGLEALLQHLATSLSKVVLMQDGSLALTAYAAPPFSSLSREELGGRLAGNAGLAEWSEGSKAQWAEGEVGLLELSIPGWAQLVISLNLGEGVVGYLSFLGRSGEMGEVERLALQKVAPVIAMEVSRERSIFGTREQMERGFFRAFLAGGFRSEEGLRRQAGYLGYRLAPSYVVLAFGLEGERSRNAGLDEMVRRELARLDATALAWSEEGTLVVLYPAEETDSLAQVAERMRTNLSEKLGADVMVGMGRFHPGLAGVSEGFREARDALELARNSLGGGRVVDYRELGIYQLLLPLRESQELELFHRDKLGKLLDYDQERDAELVKTLEAFLENSGNLAETARALNLHRNSLIYRLERLARVAGVDLESAEERLNLAVAIRIGRLLGKNL